uniref:cerebellin 18 n=1 Tax=Doryrhamphus excisus TaxID=161450 RepID=UPI0025AE2FCB|nr:cerebellin 18 [Doryrhamphus excisus]
MLVSTLLTLLGVLSLHGCAEAQSIQPINQILKDIAMNLDNTLTCAKWDCKCTFDRQRGCCCAANDMFRVEDETFTRMTSLRNDISSLKSNVHALTTGMKIAFAASMGPNPDQCYGPFNTNVPIAYPVVTLNDGKGYNPSVGVFTAPHAGVFVFSSTVYSLVISGQRVYYRVKMMKNGEVMTSMSEDNRDDNEDTANQMITLELQRGDQVYMQLDAGRKLCKNLNNNVFSGYMLYAYPDE